MKRKKFTKENISLIISLFSLFIAAMGIGYALIQIELALYQSEFSRLNISHSVDMNSNRIIINIENDAKRKETTRKKGTGYFLHSGTCRASSC